jgi:ADP-heptose:LPS heptosyltransferase
MSAAHPGWRAARRILCVRLDALGDVLMCTPALRALRGALPGSRLTLLGSASGAAAVPFIPEIDDVIVHAAPWMQGDGAGISVPGTAAARQAGLALVDTLAARAFDAAVIFTTYTQSALPAALLCQLAGIPLRLAHCRENPYALLSDWVPDPEPASTVRHEVQRQLALVRHIGCVPGELGLSFVPRAADHAGATAGLRSAGIDQSRPWILLHPGAGAAARRYPAAHWAQAISLLSAATEVPLVLAGGVADVDLVEDIRRRAGADAGWPARPGRAGRGAADGRGRRRQQQRTGPHRRRARHAAGRAVCADQSPAHPVGHAQPGAVPRCGLPFLFQEHVPGGTSQLPGRGATRARGGGGAGPAAAGRRHPGRGTCRHGRTGERPLSARAHPRFFMRAILASLSRCSRRSRR